MITIVHVHLVITMFHFRVSERDVLMSREHYQDLRDRLGIAELSTQIPLPQVFLNGQLLGVSKKTFV